MLVCCSQFTVTSLCVHFQIHVPHFSVQGQRQPSRSRTKNRSNAVSFSEFRGFCEAVGLCDVGMDIAIDEYCHCFH